MTGHQWAGGTPLQRAGACNFFPAAREQINKLRGRWELWPLFFVPTYIRTSILGWQRGQCVYSPQPLSRHRLTAMYFSHSLSFPALIKSHESPRLRLFHNYWSAANFYSCATLSCTGVNFAREGNRCKFGRTWIAASWKFCSLGSSVKGKKRAFGTKM